jgi:hypothetical protein
VLAGVNEQFGVLLAQEAGDRRGLDELRAVADYGEDLQEASSARIRATAPAAVRRVAGPGPSK